MASGHVPTLLAYQKTLLSEIHDPTSSDLVLIARGLGLRKLVCGLLQIYHGSDALVLLVNATGEEEKGIGSELGTMGVRNPGLRVVDYELSKKDRQALYRKGGLVSVTSRILVVDMLLKDIPVELITGMVVLHADKVSPTSLESFIARLYRMSNKDGFIKAFSDQPEQFHQGMFPLKSVMTELQLRKTHILPRFHTEVQLSLGRRKADVVELYVTMTPRMQDIHQNVVQCISATLNELKRSNTTLDLDDLNVENAYFKSFDTIVRRQLDPVWHKVGAKTKQLVSDLGTLRRLLTYLLTLDPISFHSYLETIIASNFTPTANPLSMREKSDWLFTDSAHIIITTAKARCYEMEKSQKATTNLVQTGDDEWETWDDVHGSGKAANPKPGWLPSQMKPVLEVPPKWKVLADIILEIETEIITRPLLLSEPGTNVILVMTADARTAAVLRDFLSSAEPERGISGRKMLERRLRGYLWWKRSINPDFDKAPRTDLEVNEDGPETTGLSEALRKKDEKRNAIKLARRRTRGGAATQHTDKERRKQLERSGMMPAAIEMDAETDIISQFLASQPELVNYVADDVPDDNNNAPPAFLAIDEDATNVDDQYGLVIPEEVVIVRVYGDDGDDQLLNELRPRFIVMYEPNQDFIRRIEVYRSSNPGLGVRVYFMVYHLTSEEHKYLAGQRREKDAFERLIKERGSMLLTLTDGQAALYSETVTSLNSRIGGGGKDIVVEPPRVIVDMREFRSSLPNLLDKIRLQVIPATLTVGDYILSPDICVERKSLPDLIQSLNSGRLFAQCELMSAHYTYPTLLIEFEESKAFSLQTLADAKTAPKKRLNDNSNANAGPKTSNANDSLVQSKLVLLTLAFPRLRIIWSSSPYSSADIFKDMKLNHAEPEVVKAIAIGAEEDRQPIEGEYEDINAAAEDLVRALPGVGMKNVRYVMKCASTVAALCELPLAEVQDILGVEPGKTCFDFIHKRNS